MLVSMSHSSDRTDKLQQPASWLPPAPQLVAGSSWGSASNYGGIIEQTAHYKAKGRNDEGCHRQKPREKGLAPLCYKAKTLSAQTRGFRC